MEEAHSIGYSGDGDHLSNSVPFHICIDTLSLLADGDEDEVLN